MIRNLLILAFVFVSAFTVPAVASTAEQEPNAAEQVDERNNINITVNRSTLHVTGASGLVLEVVSLTGKPVATVKIESPAQRVELNIPKGCYILKIGKVVRKVSIH
ncbi:secretion protein [Xylanibacter rodentium]|jgi:hypothetical protein|uniref:Secretion protein n=1 Tax=Xylanibacter rodentium TaxID=2736289 RepID=A0ABX2AUJ0_9BACT|nr:secretion protein [Xylanibacter rodentium]NPE10907.1 secretion protein [Prevotella sp. PJ1A]NPE13806.1 secretion protein [Xylanibacter rodentium]NPE37730.1 secretion protein [Prevotella sp. PCJ2]